jgi:hypothetical protein
MTSEPDLPGVGPSVSVIDTAWGTVIRTRTALGMVAAVKLRRLASRPPDGIVLLDVRRTSVAEPVVVAAVADLAAGLPEGALRVVRSARTPPALVEAAGAPVYTSFSTALGCRPSPADPRVVDLPDRPAGRLPPATGGRRGTGPDGSPLPPGAPVRARPAPVSVPRPRRPEGA